LCTPTATTDVDDTERQRQQEAVQLRKENM
jgi:hypothetical protein